MTDSTRHAAIGGNRRLGLLLGVFVGALFAAGLASAATLGTFTSQEVSAGSFSAAASGIAQSTGGIGASSSKTLTLTFPAATTAGHLIALSAYAPSCGGSPTVSDSATQTWTVEDLNPTGSDHAVLAYKASSDPITTITVTCSSNSKIHASAADFTGGTNTVDQHTSASAASTSSPASGTTGATSAASELIVGSIGWGANKNLSGTTSGFITVDSQADNGGGEQLAFKAVTATGTFSYGGTLSGASAWGAFVYAFK